MYKRQTFTLIINPINDPPTVEKIGIEVNEDDIYSFDNVEFEYNDVETDELSTIKVLTLPENGQLVFDGGELQLIEENTETVIEVDQLDLLTFRPALNWFGETDFLICVNDDGQTIFGLDENGEETDVTPYGESISVIVVVPVILVVFKEPKKLTTLEAKVNV